MSQEKRPLRRIVYYPADGADGSDPNQLETVVPKPIMLNRSSSSSRPYLFPIIGEIIEMIRSILEARLNMFQPTSTMPRKLVRDVVRDASGRIIEESFTEY
jgi:hypothetical protein